MSVRHVSEEYPEHLNPFHSRKSSFKESIRGLKNTLVRSFRGKNKPEIRKRQDIAAEQQSRHTLSVIPRTRVEEILPLPRSRFSERVPKEKNTQAQGTEQNPFDENQQPVSTETKVVENQPQENQTPTITETKVEENQPEVSAVPIPNERRRLKRRKKRAPIPPNANGGVRYLAAPTSGSEWSLVSTDTEFSSTCVSDYEHDHDHGPTENYQAEEILQITEEIQKLTEKFDGNQNLNNGIVITEVPEPEAAGNKISENAGKVVECKDNMENGLEVFDNNSEKKEESVEVAKVTIHENGLEEVIDNNSKKEEQKEERINSAEITIQEIANQTEDEEKNKAKSDLITTNETHDKVTSDDHNNNTQIEVRQKIENENQEVNADFNFSQNIVVTYSKDEANEETFLYREKRSVSLSSCRTDMESGDDSLVGKRLKQFERTSSARDISPLKGRSSIPTKENMLG